MQETGCCRYTARPSSRQTGSDSATRAPDGIADRPTRSNRTRQSATLKWSSTGATDLTLSGVGDVGSAGTRDVQPAESITYILTVKGPGGSATATASVTVNVPPAPVAQPVVEPKSFAERVDTELADIYFDFDKSDIRPDARTILTEHADALRSILKDFPDGIIALEAIATNAAPPNTTWHSETVVLCPQTHSSGLSESSQTGSSRSAMAGKGRNVPQCTEPTEECWQKNRRVHFSPAMSAPTN